MLKHELPTPLIFLSFLRNSPAQDGEILIYNCRNFSVISESSEPALNYQCYRFQLKKLLSFDIHFHWRAKVEKYTQFSVHKEKR